MKNKITYFKIFVRSELYMEMKFFKNSFITSNVNVSMEKFAVFKFFFNVLLVVNPSKSLRALSVSIALQRFVHNLTQ